MLKLLQIENYKLQIKKYLIFIIWIKLKISSWNFNLPSFDILIVLSIKIIDHRHKVLMSNASWITNKSFKTERFDKENTQFLKSHILIFSYNGFFCALTVFAALWSQSPSRILSIKILEWPNYKFNLIIAWFLNFLQSHFNWNKTRGKH